MNEKSTVLVFGVFDRLHAGHLYFLRQAAKHGKVIVAVARNTSAQELKNKDPMQSEKKRTAELKKTPLVFKAVLGDKKMGEYKVIKKIKPDIICLGYDQKSLERDLKKYLSVSGHKIKIVHIKSFKPDKFHTSLLK